jgi:uncharacterized membrane-anchored protein YitT (DUF2179 family)
VVAYYASETGGAGAMGDYIARAWGRTAGLIALGIYVVSLIFAGAAGFTIAVGDLASRFSQLYFGVDSPGGQAHCSFASRRGGSTSAAPRSPRRCNWSSSEFPSFLLF